MANERANPGERAVEPARADVRLVQRTVGAVQRDLHVADPIRRETRGVRVADQPTVGDDLRRYAMRGQQIEQLEQVGARERLAAGERDVVELDRIEQALDAQQQLVAVASRELGAAVFAPGVVAIVALLVTVRGELDRDAIELRPLRTHVL